MKLGPFTYSLCLVCCIVSTALADWVQTTGPEAGPVTQLSVDPTNGQVFAVANESAYRSQDGGATWEPLFNGLPGNLVVVSIAAHGSTAYVAGTLGAGIGFFRSNDGGSSWVQATGTGMPGPIVWAIWTDGSTILAALEGNGVYKSTNGGDNWTASNTGIPANTGIARFALRGTDLYAGTSVASSVKAIYRSTDGGATWSATNVTFITGFNYLFGLAANTAGVFAATATGGCYRSTDNGASWQKVNPGIATDFETAIVANDLNVYAGIANGTIYRADENGNGWTAVNTGLPPANAGLSVAALAAGGSSVLAAEGKFGVYRTTNDGANWARSNSGLRAGRVNGMLSSPPYVFAAVDGAGFYCTPNAGSNWVEIDNGIGPYDGWYHFARTGGTLLGGSGQGKLYRSDNNGENWTLSNAGLGLTGTFCFAVDEVSPSTVYAAGYVGIYKSIDSGMNWSALPTGFTVSQTVLDVIKDGSYMVAGANAGFKRSINNGDSWDAPISGLPTFGSFPSFTRLGNTLFAATTGGGIYRSVNHGETWTASNTGVGGTPGAVLAVGTDLYAATSTGVFKSADGGDLWSNVSEGFPANLTVTKLATDDTYLYAGTFRNSVWRRPLSEMGTTPVLASLVTAEAESDRVKVSWHLESARQVLVQRRTPTTAWTNLAARDADGLGYVTVEDRKIEPGARYGYRLGWTDGRGEVTSGEVWVDIPRRAEFALYGARPNPNAGDPAIALVIPAAGRVRLELFDLSGRRAGEAHEVDLAAGYHLLPISSWGTQPAGVYVARLTFGGKTRSTRVVMTR